MNTSTRQVRFQNTISSSVSVHEPAFGIHREFPGKGAVQMIPFEIVEQLLWRQGFKNLITSGILYIESMEDKIDLGLEAPDTKTPTNIKIFTPEQILTLLKVKNFTDFKADIDSVSIEQAKAVVEYAVANNIVDMQKVDYLKTITGKDVVQMINRKRMMEEADRIAAEKEAARRREGEFNAI